MLNSIKKWSKNRCKEKGHFWLWPWQTSRRCALCGAMNKLKVGENTVGVEDELIQWSSSAVPAALGDLGMDTATGRAQLYVAGMAQEVALLSDIAGNSGVLLIHGATRTAYATIAAAIAASVSGDVIQLGPITYSESFTIPAGVTMIGITPDVTKIDGAAATGTRVQMSDGSALKQVAVEAPTNAVAAIIAPAGGAAEFAVLEEVYIIGTGASGIGIQIVTGGLVISNTTFRSGTIDAFVQVDSGTAILNDVRLWTVVAMTSAWRINGGTVNASGLWTTATTVPTNCVEIDGGTLSLRSFTFEGGTNAFHITSDGTTIDLLSGLITSGTYDILVDPGVSTGTFHAIGIEISQKKTSAPGDWWADADILIVGNDTDEGDQCLFSWGKLRVGQAEKGYSSAFGEGQAYNRDIVVLTTDATAGAAADGGNFIDVSDEASSPSGSTFSFQGTAQNHTILFCTTLEDATTVLKHFGHKYYNTTASTTDGVYQFEIWDGAAWTESEMLVNSDAENYRYADNPFIRANSEEYIDLRINETVTWATKTINGTLGYWSRVRIMTAPTTAPVFEQWKLSSSHADINQRGLFIAHGLARWKETVLSSGNIYGESGGVSDATIAVGAGGLPTGWNHIIKNCSLNGNGDAIYFQFSLPRGICTACPLIFRVYYVADPGGGSADLILSMLPVETSGVNVADPAGGATPTARTVANTSTLTANVAQTTGATAVPSVVANKMHAMDLGQFDIDQFYEGDMMLMRLELDDAGATNNDIEVFAVEVIGIKFAFGERL